MHFIKVKTFSKCVRTHQPCLVYGCFSRIFFSYFYVPIYYYRMTNVHGVYFINFRNETKISK